jgi:spore maturation protein CgeB
MRVLVVDTFYPAFVESHYRANPSLRDETYDVQWRSLMDTFFAKADAYSHYLGEQGHEAREVVADVEPLQLAWAREHGVRVPRGRLRARTRLERIVAAQVESFRPDVLYVQNLSVLRADLLQRFGRDMLVVGQIASEAPPEHQLRAFDLILTSFPHYVERFRSLGVASEYLQLAFDSRVLDRVGRPPRDLDVVFVGALGRTQHSRGNALLDAAAARLPLAVWGREVEQRPAASALRRAYRGEAWGLDMLRLFARARVALNRHIDVAEDYANNMRLYEVTGMGALLLTDAKRNLGELFDVGREVVAYGNEDELVDLARYYLEHEDERAEIAAAGQRRTLSDHSYANRMRELVGILERYRG